MKNALQAGAEYAEVFGISAVRPTEIAEEYLIDGPGDPSYWRGGMDKINLSVSEMEMEIRVRCKFSTQP